MDAWAIKAIPTDCRGFTMRSRLEAKWATFFDLCGWPWSYEPCESNGWIPDFAVGEVPTLCEVKPFFKKSEWSDTVGKIWHSGCRQPVLLLGCDPVLQSFGEGRIAQVGFLADPCEFGFEVDVVLFGFTEGNKKLGLCQMDLGWKNLIWNVPSSQPSMVYFSNEEEVAKHLAEPRAEACNATRWLPRAAS